MTAILLRLLLLLMPPTLAIFLTLNPWKGAYGTNAPDWYTHEWMCSFTLFAWMGLLLSYKSKFPATALPQQLVFLSPFLAFLPAWMQLSVYPVYSWDYDCYRIAADRISEGLNPYGEFYFYPPLTAWAISAVNRITQSHQITFMLYQYLQLLLVAGLILQIHKVLSRLNFKPEMAAMILMALMTFNVPLWRTLHYNQVNLVLLNILFFILLAGRKHALASGAAMALGILIKIYPILLPGIWLLRKQGKHILFGIVFLIAGIAFLEMQMPNIWQQFLAFITHFPAGDKLRDNSIHSILYNAGILLGIADANDSAYKHTIYKVYLMISVLIAFAFVYRVIKRAFAADADSSRDFYMHISDAGACMLLISPMVWEHHYVLAMPLALMAISMYRNTFYPVLWAGILLIFVFPVTDIFLLSLNRILGLMILLYLTRPGIQQDPILPELSSGNSD
jgi:hypothetical protein